MFHKLFCAESAVKLQPTSAIMFSAFYLKRVFLTRVVWGTTYIALYRIAGCCHLVNLMASLQSRCPSILQVMMISVTIFS